MKILIVLTIQFIVTITNGQISFDTVKMKERFVNELKKVKEHEWSNPFCDSCTKIKKKADSLFEISTLQECLQYFEDSAYVLKVYSFLKILELDDSIAFIKLSESIKDSTPVFLRTYDAGWAIKFNKFISTYYKDFISKKYQYGGKLDFYGKICIFPVSNPLVWTQKDALLKFLINKGKLQYEDLVF